MNALLLRRIGAYLLDITVLFVVLGPLGYLVQRALGLSPDTAQVVYAALVVNFSLPVWTYFTWSDHSRRGATLGKRVLSVRVVAGEAKRVGLGQALARTAVKMLPWEVAHASAFLLAPSLGIFSVWSWIGIGLSYALSLGYLVVAWRTQGHRSVHDLVASTQVQRATDPVPKSTA